MFLNTSRSVGSLSFYFVLTSVVCACSTNDGATSMTSSGGSSASTTSSGGNAPVGGTSSNGTGTTGAQTGGAQSTGGAASATGGKAGATGGTGTRVTTSGQASGGKTTTGGSVSAGGTSNSGTSVGGSVTGGTRSTGGSSNNSAGTGASAGGKGTESSKASGGSSNGGNATGGTISGGGASAGGTSSTGNTSAGTNTGGTQSTGGTSNAGGTNAAGAGTGGGSLLSIGACTLGAGTQEGEGRTEEQYYGANVKRNGVNYKMITNGWGDGWISHDISWLGTSLNIQDYQGSRQSNGAPAGFPTVFCGRYSDTSLECGLPRALANITAMNTAVSWTHAAADGKYNASYDVWLGDGAAMRRGLQSYFMVWLHDPVDEQPAGSLTVEGVTVADIPGKWNIITGTVNSLPIVNYVRAEGDETHQIAFDIMDFIRDAQTRKFSMPGNDVLAVAFGFEIWSGPVTELKLDDFCLDIQ